MKLFRTKTGLTILFSSIIIVGAGHGGGPIALLEVFWLPGFFGFRSEDFSFSLTAPYDQSLVAATMFSFTGHVLLLTSLLVKKINAKFWIETLGLIFLWLAFYYIVHDISHGVAQIGLLTGLPFLVVSGLLFLKNIKRKLAITVEY